MDPNDTIRDSLTGKHAAAHRDGRAGKMNAPTQPMRVEPEAGHTPGPWTIGTPNRCEIWADDKRQGCGVAHVNALYAEAEANARLIAAAPAMLEALREILFTAQSNEGDSDDVLLEVVIERAKAAIARATGKG